MVVSMMAVPSTVLSTSPAGRRPYNPDMVQACDIKVEFNLSNKRIGKGCYGPSCHDVDPGTENDWGLVCLLATIHYLTNWIFYIIMTVVMVMILAGAFMFLTSSGDAAKTSKATKTITFAIVGMVIALLARAIPVAVRHIVGL